MHVHILGICGTLMGSIATLATALGHRVTGTDQNVYPPMSTQLEAAGIQLSSPYAADSIPPSADIVIVGNAGLPRGNPAVEAMLRRRVPYTSGAEWLSRNLLGDRRVVAVAGTHGKTTTTSMVAWILEQAGLNPGFLVGGVPTNFGTSSRLGESPFFVIEADEYDTSYFDRRSKFLHYRPTTLVINNLEFDHADIFPDLAAIQAQFHLLLRTVPDDGLVIHPQSDRNIADMLEMGCWSPTLPIGSDRASVNPTNADASRFTCNIEDEQGTVEWSLAGHYNMANALAAVAAARHCGVAVGAACDALCTFTGVKRRMEVIHSAGGITVYDDFAHHPTAIRTTLQGARTRIGDERLVAVIEPASHTMRQGVHADNLSDSASCADYVFWYRPDEVAWDMDALASGESRVISDIGTLVEEVLAQLSPGTHLVIMSNGAFEGFHQRLLARLAT